METILRMSLKRVTEWGLVLIEKRPKQERRGVLDYLSYNLDECAPQVIEDDLWGIFFVVL